MGKPNWGGVEWHEPWHGRKWESSDGRTIYVGPEDAPLEIEVPLRSGTRHLFVAAGQGDAVPYVVVGGRRYVPAPERDWDDVDAND